nr:MetaGeneMark_Unknown Function [uncultured bacterium]
MDQQSARIAASTFADSQKGWLASGGLLGIGPLGATALLASAALSALGSGPSGDGLYPILEEFSGLRSGHRRIFDGWHALLRIDEGKWLPGIVINRRALSSLAASVSISRVTSLMRISSRFRSSNRSRRRLAFTAAPA